MLIFALPTSTFAQSNSNGISVTNYYVSPTGNDLNPGTLDQPFATIQKAANVATEGSTIYIRGGVYNQKFVSLILVPQAHPLLFKVIKMKKSFSMVLKSS